MKTVFVLYCLLFATWRVGADITAEGFETGQVSFQCSHRFAQRNNKYLCENSCTRNEDVLLTVKPGERVGSERITLEDWGDGVFTVTFSQLRLTDSGTYWCGVNRPGADTFTKVHLIVKEGIVNATAFITPRPFPSWTYQNMSSVTQQTPEVKTSWPTTASNFTNGREQSNSIDGL
ncbi:CMRF35-like molecule 1 [Xyrichtys novacula]|uniref:CMRF35-like molecule 1 n=1 Tax=Xyrichtys novacula TaxID=13765 RepID=A0AAV1EWW0_XYRNO|nr:CMRF35-like molecule 1 [Xyrichtys novacula]